MSVVGRIELRRPGGSGMQYDPAARVAPKIPAGQVVRLGWIKVNGLLPVVRGGEWPWATQIEVCGGVLRVRCGCGGVMEVRPKKPGEVACSVCGHVLLILEAAEEEVGGLAESSV